MRMIQIKIQAGAKTCGKCPHRYLAPLIEEWYCRLFGRMHGGQYLATAGPNMTKRCQACLSADVPMVPPC